jgi:hypothetical protein
MMLPAPLAAPVTTPEPTRPTIIEIVLDGRRTVRVGAEVDTGALIRIIEALEKRR